MLGKRFQRTTSMAQIGPAFSVTPAAAPPPPASDYQCISQWEILKQAEEMMMKMVAAAASTVPEEAAALSRGGAVASPARRPPAESFLRGTFLDNCFFCKRRLKQERDIFIYRGDSAFCTEECRQRQILKDERSMTASKKGSAASVAA